MRRAAVGERRDEMRVGAPRRDFDPAGVFMRSDRSVATRTLQIRGLDADDGQRLPDFLLDPPLDGFARAEDDGFAAPLDDGRAAEVRPALVEPLDVVELGRGADEEREVEERASDEPERSPARELESPLASAGPVSDPPLPFASPFESVFASPAGALELDCACESAFAPSW